MTPNIILPANLRKAIYLTFGLIGLGLGAAAVWFTSVGDPVPSYLVRAGAVDSFIVAAPLLIALLNINRDDPNLKNDVPAPKRAADQSPAPAEPEDADEFDETEDEDTSLPVSDASA